MQLLICTRTLTFGEVQPFVCKREGIMRIRNAKDLGLLIRDQRKRVGWSQSDLGHRIGASRNWVSEVERGKPTAEVELVLKALQTLGLSLDTHERGGAIERAPGKSGMHVGVKARIVRARGREGPSLTSGGKPLSAIRRGEDA